MPNPATTALFFHYSQGDGRHIIGFCRDACSVSAAGMPVYRRMCRAGTGGIFYIILMTLQ
jgi:hypothetical protein